MYEILNAVYPYITGLYTLPWILVGFLLTIIIAQITSRKKIDTLMKKIGLILLYFFIPVLIFRIFLNTDFGAQQIEFALIVSIIVILMYLLAYTYARITVKKLDLKGPKKQLYLNTALTNQGRSSAFIGGALLTSTWSVEAAIYIALVGIGLFAVIPYILSYIHKKESHQQKKAENVKGLPWYLKLYPWYLISFVVAGIALHSFTGQNSLTLLGENTNTLLKFYTAITIPAALYYVGASIHPSDLKKTELKKLFGFEKAGENEDHWLWVRKMFFLASLLTPLLTLAFIGPIFFLGYIPNAWFAVIIINSILPITSTNMFLIPYGIDKKSTAHVVTWTTLICVPIVVALIMLLGIYIP